VAADNEDDLKKYLGFGGSVRCHRWQWIWWWQHRLEGFQEVTQFWWFYKGIRRNVLRAEHLEIAWQITNCTTATKKRKRKKT